MENFEDMVYFDFYYSFLYFYIFFIFISSYLFSFSLYLFLSLFFFSLCYGLSRSFFFSLKAAGSDDEALRYGHPFVRNEVRVLKIEVFLRFSISVVTLSYEMMSEYPELRVF